MKKVFFSAIVAVACIGAFAFKAHTTSFTYYYDGGQVTDDQNICPGTTGQCTILIGEEVKNLFVDPQLTNPAHRD